jgi:hypothetical protein
MASCHSLQEMGLCPFTADIEDLGRVLRYSTIVLPLRRWKTNFTIFFWNGQLQDNVVFSPMMYYVQEKHRLYIRRWIINASPGSLPTTSECRTYTWTQWASPFRARICKRLRSPEIDSARLCSLAVRYDKKGCRTGPLGWESIPGLIKGLQIRAQTTNIFLTH